tara:strand:+ start:1171 stop:1380 length:210 start_codon:yes stop_codon:yes gene_type:complete
MHSFRKISEKLFSAANINKFIKGKYNILEHNNITLKSFNKINSKIINDKNIIKNNIKLNKSKYKRTITS